MIDFIIFISALRLLPAVALLVFIGHMMRRPAAVADAAAWQSDDAEAGHAPVFDAHAAPAGPKNHPARARSWSNV